MAGQDLCQILAILILDNDGARLAVKYSSVARKEIFPTVKLQLAFEKRVIAKLPKNTGARTEVDVAVIDDFTVLHQACNDVVVCAVATSSENELVVLQLVEGVFSSMSSVAGGSFLSAGLTKQQVLDNLSDVLFILDEVTDDGIIMETDAEKIDARVKMIDDPEPKGEGDGKTPKADEMFAKATQSAKSRIFGSLMGGRG